MGSCTGHTAGIYAVAFSPDGAHLATGGFDGQRPLVSRVGLHAGEELRARAAPRRPAMNVAARLQPARCTPLMIVVALIVSASSASAQPVITDLQPRGAQKGKPFTLTLTGRNLGEGARIRSTLPASFTLADARSARSCARRTDAARGSRGHIPRRADSRCLPPVCMRSALSPTTASRTSSCSRSARFRRSAKTSRGPARCPTATTLRRQRSRCRRRRSL